METAVQRGVTFGFYARNGVLGSEWAFREVDKMAELNVDHVVLTPTVMQETAHTVRQYRDFEVTPNDHELYKIIEYIHGRGMSVCLRPMTETQDGCGRLQIWFQPDRERIPGRRSEHWRNWFESFRLRSVHYARIAEETGCELYGLDSELDRTVDHHDEYKRVIESVRSVFSGRVTSCHTTHTHMIDFERELSNASHWWRDLDELQLSCYERAESAPGAALDEMVENLLPVRDRFRKIAALYGKPVSFGECGCTSSYGAAMNPSGWSSKGGFDGLEQARYLEAMLMVFWEEPWWAGLYWWKWDEQNVRPQFSDDPRGDKGFVIYGKPAAGVMRKWFARSDRKSVRRKGNFSSGVCREQCMGAGRIR